MQPLSKSLNAMKREDNQRRAQPGRPNGTPTQPAHPALTGVAQEHAVLVRLMGKLQASVSASLADKEAQLQALSGEVLRLRAQLLVTRTAVFWGLTLRTVPVSHPSTARRASPQRPGAGDQAGLHRVVSARQLVCQTGCVGHAHHWLTAEGTCQLSGQACEREILERTSD